MANFSNLALTVNGIKALLRAQMGERLTLSKIGLGSGSVTNGTNLTSLVTPKLMLPISEKEINEKSGYITISAIMTNENITEGFYWRETGLFYEDSNGNDVLFAYTCVTNNEYDYIPAYSDQRYLKYVRIADIVTDSADITIKETEGLLYVDTLTFESFKKEVKESMENIESNSLTNKDEDGNQRQLVVNGTENNGKDAIYIVDTVNGEEVIFSIYGEHNPPPVVDNLESESTTLALSANQGRVVKGYITAENGMVFQFAYDESTGEYGHVVTDSEGADTFYPFSGKWKRNIVDSLANTNLGLTYDSTWPEIAAGISSLFPESLNLLSVWGVTSINKQGDASYTSPEFDITHFNTLTVTCDYGQTSGGGTYSCNLVTTSGNVSILGTKTIDISEYTGVAYVNIKTTGKDMSGWDPDKPYENWGETNSYWHSSGYVKLKKLIVQV